MKNHEKWLYLENIISQQLLMCYLIGNTMFTIFYTNNMNVDFHLGIFIMLNIILSLLAFLVAVRQKLYLTLWGYIGVGLAVFQLFRLMWIPEEISNPLRNQLILLLIITSGFALAGSVICLKRSSERRNLIAENHIDISLLQQ